MRSGRDRSLELAGPTVSADTDVTLLRDRVFGSIQSLIIARRDACSDEAIEKLVDIVLYGAA